MKVEGRKSHAEICSEVVALVRKLRRKRPKGGRLTYREIAAELRSQGHVNKKGNEFSASAIKNMLS